MRLPEAVRNLKTYCERTFFFNCLHFLSRNRLPKKTCPFLRTCLKLQSELLLKSRTIRTYAICNVVHFIIPSLDNSLEVCMWPKCVKESVLWSWIFFYFWQTLVFFHLFDNTWHLHNPLFPLELLVKMDLIDNKGHL